MFLLIKILVIIAVSTALFISWSDCATIDIGSQIGVIHSSIQASRGALVAGVRDLQFHQDHYHSFAAESLTADGDSSLIVIPKSCFTTPPTLASVNNCALQLKLTNLPSPCRSTTFNPANCGNLLTGVIQSEISTRGPQANATAKCFMAIKSFSANVTSKCAAVVNQLASTPASSNINAVLNVQCAIVSGPTFMDCKASLTATSEVESLCPGYNLGFILAASASVMEVIEGPISTVCIKDEIDASQTCLSGVLSTFTNFTDKLDLDSISDTVLNGMCKSCMLTILDKIASLGGVIKGPLVGLQTAVTAIQIICTRDPTDSSRYCVKVFGETAALTLKNKNSAPSNDDFSLICSPCLNAMLLKAKDSTLFAPALVGLTAIQKLCPKDRISGNYCGATLYKQAKSAAAALSACSALPPCSTACKAAVQGLFNEECCYSTVGFSAMVPFVQDLLDKTSLARFTAAALCPSDITKKCNPPAISTVTMDISLPNIDASVIDAKAAVSNAVRAALIKDLSLILALDASDLTVLGLSADPATQGGLKATIRFTIEATLRDRYVNNFRQRLQKKGGLPLSNTAVAAQSNQATIIDGESVSASMEGGYFPSSDTSNASYQYCASTALAAFMISAVLFMNV